MNATVTDKENVVLYTSFNNGAFMEMNGYKVYMDARPELFMEKINGKEDVYTEYVSVESGTCDLNAFLAKYNFTHLIARDGSPLSVHLRAYDDAYKIVVDGEGYCLFQRVS